LIGHQSLNSLRDSMGFYPTLTGLVPHKLRRSLSGLEFEGEKAPAGLAVFL
jgi:hypothetical protein